MAAMNSYKARLSSFKKAYRVSSGAPTLKWPHPDSWKVNPAALAAAGFYFAPSADDPDNVVCFMCEKEIGAWDEEDDPHEVHWQKCGDRCPWAIARCGAECGMYGSDPSQAPAGKIVEKARLATFTNQDWPHDATKNHGASSKNMVKAGFVYNPQKSGVEDDTAICPYCTVSLHGWEAEDNPLNEHRTRAAKLPTSCVFLSALNSAASKSRSRVAASTMALPPISAKAPSRSSSRKSMRSQRSRSPSIAPSERESMAEPALGRSRRGVSAAEASTSMTALDPEETPVGKRGGRTSSKKGAAPGRKAARKKGTAASGIETDTDATDGTDAEDGKRKRASRTRSKATVNGSSEAGEVEDAPASKPTKGRKTVTAKEEVLEYEIVLQEPPRRGSRKASMASLASARPPDDGSDAEVEHEAAKARKNSGRKTVTNRDVSRAVGATDVEDEPPSVPAATKGKAKASGKSLGRSTRSKQSIMATDSETDANIATAAPPKPKGRAVSRSLARSRSVAPTEAESEAEDVITIAPPKTKGRTTSKSLVRSRSMAPTESDADEAPPIARLEPVTRTRSKSVTRSRSVAPAEESDVDEAVTVVTAKPTRARARGKSVARSTSRAASPEPEEVATVAAPVPKGRTASRKVARVSRRGPSMALAREEDEPVPEPPKGRARSKVTARPLSRAESIVSEYDKEADSSAPLGRLRSGRAPSRVFSRAPSPVSNEDAIIVAPTKSKPNGRTRSKSVVRGPGGTASVAADEDTATARPKAKRKEAKPVAEGLSGATDANMDGHLPPPKRMAKAAVGRGRAPSVTHPVATRSEAETDDAHSMPAKANRKVTSGPPKARSKSRAHSVAVMSEDDEYETAEEEEHAASPLLKGTVSGRASRSEKSVVRRLPSEDGYVKRSDLQRQSKLARDSVASNDPLDVLDDDTISLPAPKLRSTNGAPPARAPSKPPSRADALPTPKAKLPPQPGPAKPVAAPPPLNDDDPMDDDDDIVEVSDEETRMFRLNLESKPQPRSQPPAQSPGSSGVDPSFGRAVVKGPSQERPPTASVKDGGEDMVVDEPMRKESTSVPPPATPPSTKLTETGPTTPSTVKRIPMRTAQSNTASVPLAHTTTATNGPLNPVTAAEPAPPLAFTPALTVLERVIPGELSSDERAMTVEQWIRREMQLEYKCFAEDAERRLRELEEYAAKVRAAIVALPARESIGR